MDDWIKESIDRARTAVTSALDAQRQEEWEKRTAKLGIDEYFELLKSAVKRDAPLFSKEAYGEARVVRFGYRGHGDDGRHFLLEMGSYVYLVELLPERNRIEAAILLGNLETAQQKIPGGFLCVELVDREFRDSNQTKMNEVEFARRMLEILYTAALGEWPG